MSSDRAGGWRAPEDVGEPSPAGIGSIIGFSCNSSLLSRSGSETGSETLSSGPEAVDSLLLRLLTRAPVGSRGEGSLSLLYAG